MRLFKRSLGAVMAAQTKRSPRLHQKVFLVGTVREVASGTALWPHFMNDLLFVILFFVALKASLIPFRFQQMAELRGMRVMASRAFPPLQSGMDIRFVHPYLVFAVAGIADFVSFLLQNQFWD